MPTPEEVIQRASEGLTPGDIIAKAQAGMPKEEGGGGVASSLLSGAKMAGEAGGALAGGLLGAPAGPAGMVAGGAIGAALGNQIGELVQDWGRAMGYQGLGRSPDVVERSTNAANAAILDGAFSMGAPILGSVLRGGKRLLTRLLGVDSRGYGLAKQAAEEFGIELGAGDVSNNQAQRFVTKVFGQFPLTGRGFKKAAARKEGQAIAAKDRLFLQLGPSMNMAEFGMDLNKAADERFATFRTHVNEMYGRARDLAKSSKATIPSSGILEEVQQGLLEMKKRLSPAAFAKHPYSKLARQEFQKGFPKDLPMERYEGFMEEIDRALLSAKNDGFAVHQLAQLKQAAEEALQDISDPAVKQAFDKADAAFARGMREAFGTPVAKKFERVGKNRFNVKQMTTSGPRQPDELLKIAFDSESPQAIRDLRNLVGPDLVRSATRAHLDQAWKKAGGSVEGLGKFDVDKFKILTGLDDSGSGRYAALKEMLGGTGVDIGKMERFTTSLAAALENVPPDTSSFISRRIALGGMSNLFGAVSASAAAGMVGGAHAGLAFLAGMKGASELLTNPRLLNMGNRILDPTLSEQARKMILRTMIEITQNGPER